VFLLTFEKLTIYNLNKDTGNYQKHDKNDAKENCKVFYLEQRKFF